MPHCQLSQYCNPITEFWKLNGTAIYYSILYMKNEFWNSLDFRDILDLSNLKCTLKIFLHFCFRSIKEYHDLKISIVYKFLAYYSGIVSRNSH